MDNDYQDSLTYFVVKNHEEQYSIWPTHKDMPLGWEVVDNQQGSKEECLNYIQENWTDMRPKSLREAMGG